MANIALATLLICKSSFPGPSHTLPKYSTFQVVILKTTSSFGLTWLGVPLIFTFFTSHVALSVSLHISRKAKRVVVDFTSSGIVTSPEEIHCQAVITL